MINNFLSKYGKIIRYLFAGGIATLSNLLVLFVCVNYFKLWYLSGAIISFCVAVIISYSLQKFFVFKDKYAPPYLTRVSSLPLSLSL